MLGYQVDSFPANSESWAQLTAPEDVERVVGVVREAVEQGTSFEEEFRMRAADGTWRWILSRGRVTGYDANGRPTRMSEQTATSPNENGWKRLSGPTKPRSAVSSKPPHRIGLVANRIFLRVNDRLCEMVGYPQKN